MANNEILLDGMQNDSMALLPANPLEQPPMEWNGRAMAAPPVAGIDGKRILHALRRHWVLAVALGTLLAGAAGPATYILVGNRYVASSYLRVAMQERPIVANMDPMGQMNRDSYEIYKATQQQLISSQFVLMAALRKPEVTRLDSVKEAQREGDAVVWLQDHLSVSYPNKAEIMAVGVKRPDAKEAMILCRAIVDSFLGEVVNAERDQKRQRLSELDRVYVEKETEIRGKREDLKKLAETLGTTDMETLNVKQKLALETLSMYRGEMARAQFEVRRLQSELAAQQALLKNIDASEVTDMDLELAIQNDPIARQLFVEIGWRKLDQIYTEGAVASGAKTQYAGRGQQDLKSMQQQYETRRAELADMVRQKKRGVVQGEIARLEAAIAVMSEQEQSQQKMVVEQQREAEKFGTSTVDIEMMRSDIKNMDALLTNIAEEREKLRVEVRATARVTLLGRAEEPVEPANRPVRYSLTVLAFLAAFCCPVTAVIFWDIRSVRVNNGDDISKGLGLPVIGCMPLIPARVIRRLGSPSKRNKTWHMRLTESVDGVAARVLRTSEMEQARVIMVSSAVGGEGKTTLATQLAMSLARAGRSTVLVDFDLRRPSFDEVFGIPLEPGVCDALRKQIAASTLVHKVATNNLSVVTAGRWNRAALAALSNGGAAQLFKQLREEFEFVVIDTSPLLPVADARFVSQHVDSVLLAVFRDVSEMPKIEAACEILAAFGVQRIEAVVTGTNNHMYGKHMGYESTISA
jgi:capsular exopolysaccharide synthesis family protein